jgi:hypothetical protein
MKILPGVEEGENIRNPFLSAVAGIVIRSRQRHVIVEIV